MCYTDPIDSCFGLFVLLGMSGTEFTPVLCSDRCSHHIGLPLSREPLQSHVTFICDTRNHAGRFSAWRSDCIKCRFISPPKDASYSTGPTLRHHRTKPCQNRLIPRSNRSRRPRVVFCCKTSKDESKSQKMVIPTSRGLCPFTSLPLAPNSDRKQGPWARPS